MGRPATTIPDEKRRRLVRDNAWAVALKNDMVDRDGFTVTLRSGRHRLELHFEDFSIREWRKVFKAVAAKRQASADGVAKMVNGDLED